MIQHDRPVVDTHRHVRQLPGALRNVRQGHHAARQIIAPIAQRAAGKRHIRDGRDRFAQCAAQQRKRVALFRTFIQRQRAMRRGGQDVIARHPAAIQPHRPGQIGQRGVIARSIGLIGQRGAIESHYSIAGSGGIQNAQVQETRAAKSKMIPPEPHLPDARQPNYPFCIILMVLSLPSTLLVRSVWI